MIKFKKLLEIILKENPDVLTYDGYEYDYDQGVSIFFLYDDIKSKGKYYFGYSRIKKKYFTNNKELLDLINGFKSGKFFNQFKKDAGKIDYKAAAAHLGLKDEEAHLALELAHQDIVDGDDDLNMHSDLNMFLVRLERIPDEDTITDHQLYSRVFKINKSTYVVTSWSIETGSGLQSFKKNKQFYDGCLSDSGLDPKKVIYEVDEQVFETYDEVYGVQKVQKVETEIDKKLKKANMEYVKLSSELHTNSASMTADQKAKKESELSVAKAKRDILQKAKTDGKSDLSDIELQKAILQTNKQSPTARTDLSNKIYSELEKMFPGKTYAQIQQILKDRGVSARDLVKEILKKIS